MNQYRLSAHRRLGTVCAVLCALSLSTATMYAQSLEINDGANAIGVGLFSELHPAELLPAGGVSSTFSIAGAMDVGGYFAHVTRTVDGVRGNDRSLGFVYNVLPVKQQSAVPVSLQLGFRYGLAYVDQTLVKAEFERDRDALGAAGSEFDDVSVDSTRRRYALGAGLSRTMSFSDAVALRLGAEVEYRVARTVYTTVSNAAGDSEDGGRIELRAPVNTTLYYGPRMELRLRVERNTIITTGATLLFDEVGDIMVRPELRLAFLRYQ